MGSRRVRPLIVDIQFNQGSAPWSQLVEGVHAAEEAGFGTVWNLDHFSGAMFGADTMLECFSVLAGWASVTTRIGVGSLVANVVNRTPAMLAHAAASIQNISGGRLVLGVGAGSSPASEFGKEQRVLGIDMLPRMADRHVRLVETIEEVRRIWSAAGSGDFAGFARPMPAPPIVAGINSAGLARLAGRHLDGVNIRWNHPERGELLAAAHEASGGRDDFDLSVWMWFDPALADADHPVRRELAAEGVTRIVLFERSAPNPVVIAAAASHLR